MSRTCPCGAHLAAENIGLLCLTCQKALYDASRSGVPAVVRRTRALVDTYAIPERFTSARAYLDALTVSLDELCDAFEVRLPKIEGSHLCG